MPPGTKTDEDVWEGGISLDEYEELLKKAIEEFQEMEERLRELEKKKEEMNWEWVNRHHKKGYGE